jgi:hypothetical protein
MWIVVELLPLPQNKKISLASREKKFCSFFYYQTENIKLTLGVGEAMSR